MTKVSIIVPVFNVSEYLYTKCLKSLSDLDLREYEVLVIDDGSDIQFNGINNYKDIARKYPHVEYVFKEHGGVVSARMEGIRRATGDYIAFVDADDWIDCEFFTRFVNVMNRDTSIDICIGAMVRCFPDGREQSICGHGDNRKMSRNVALEEMLAFQIFRWELCGKLYRRYLFFELPNDDIKVYEDLYWNWILFHRANFVWYSGEYKYHYYVNFDSVTQRNGRMDYSSLIAFRYIWNMKHECLSIMKLLYIHYAKNIFHHLQWILLQCLEQNKIDYELKECCQELIKIHREICEVNIDLKICFPDKRVFFAICQGYEQLHNVFVEYVEGFAKGLVEMSMRNKKICVYGLGGISKYITRIMHIYNIPISSYVVSEKQGYIEHFKGKPVKRFLDMKIEYSNSIFVLAMLESAQKDVAKNMDNNSVIYVQVDTRLLGFE